MVLMASESCVYGYRFRNLSNALDLRETVSSRLCCPLSPPIKGEAEAEVSSLSRESQAVCNSGVVRGQFLERGKTA